MQLATSPPLPIRRSDLVAFLDHARTVDAEDAAHDLAHYVSIVDACTTVANAVAARFAGTAS